MPYPRHITGHIWFIFDCLVDTWNSARQDSRLCPGFHGDHGDDDHDGDDHGDDDHSDDDHTATQFFLVNLSLCAKDFSFDDIMFKYLIELASK